MRGKHKLALFILLLLGAGWAVWFWLADLGVAVLSPAGFIAAEQRQLLVTATLLMLIVVIPVFFMTFFFAWKYREGNKSARYEPGWDHHTVAELSWWTVPGAIILVLGVITWQSSHRLDPSRPISHTAAPTRVQVIALQWKWLFIYPEQGIASLNQLSFPAGVPVSFEITADAPMNSFWIPRLGGQVYAMPGMKTKLHLSADSPGSFNGTSANLSGQGFAKMKFSVQAVEPVQFDSWVQSVKQSSAYLDANEYERLSKPSVESSTRLYGSVEPGLQQKVIASFTSPNPTLHQPNSGRHN